MSPACLWHALRLASRRAFVPVLQKLAHPNAPSRYVLASNASLIHTCILRSQNFRPPLSLSRCPTCSRPLPSSIPACANCWNIFSLPPDITHHELLGLSYEPNPFIVDLSTLKHRFRQAQAACHPDAWASKGTEKQVIAQAMSARVNEAYQALLRPLSRAEYILSRNHMSVSEEDQASDTAFMLEVMEARELVDDAEEVGEVLTLMEENDEKINETVHQIETLIHEEDWPGAKAATIRLRYLEGITRAAKKWLDNH